MTYSQISGAMSDRLTHSVRIVRSIASQARRRYRENGRYRILGPRFKPLLAVDNHILNALHRSSIERIEAGLEYVRFPVGKILTVVTVESQWIYFVEEGLISVISEYGVSRPIEIGMIGREGVFIRVVFLAMIGQLSGV